MEVLDAPASTEISAYQPFYAELAELEKSNAALVFNYETPKGNKEARSYVHKLRQTKGALEKARTGAKAEYLRLGRAVDAEAKTINERIEAMIQVHQLKLDDIENREKLRVQSLRESLNAFSTSTMATTVEQVKAEIARVEGMPVDESWQEFMAEATVAKERCLERFRKLLADYEQRDANNAELERLRREKAEQEQRDRDAKIAAEAAERVRREAEEKAKAEAAEAARKIAEAEAAAKAEAAEAARKIAEAEANARAQAEGAARREAELKAQAEEAERRRIAAEEQAKREAVAAAERAEQARLQAIADEQARVKAEAERAEREQAAREANKAHRAAINTAAMKALMEGGLTETDAKKAVTLIAQGKVPAVSINY